MCIFPQKVHLIFNQIPTFDQIENEIRTFSQNYKYISLFGDFNSRTAEEPDFIDFEINEHEQDFTEFLQNDLATLNELNIDKNRKNVDKVKSRSGNNLLDICKANNLFIVNGRIGDDKTESGQLTCKKGLLIIVFVHVVFYNWFTILKY